MIDSIRRYMMSCPLLCGSEININCLSPKAVSYSIDSVAENPLIKRYCDGGMIKQCKFVFALHGVYDTMAEENLRIAEFFEKLTDWVEKQNRDGKLPKLTDEKLTPLRIEVTKDACLLESSIDSMRYQTEFRLIYRQEV